MSHLLDPSGNPIPHGRPSPRTGTTGVGIQKFGTQQLKHLDTGGVIEKDVGARFRLFTGGEATTPATPFSASYQALRPNTIRTQAQLETSPHAIPYFQIGILNFQICLEEEKLRKNAILMTINHFVQLLKQ